MGIVSSLSLIVYHQPGSSSSAYRSVWEDLLRAHDTSVFQQDSEHASSTGRTVMQELAPMAATESRTSSPTPSQRPAQRNQQFRVQPAPQAHHTPTRDASDGTQDSRDAFRQGDRSRSVTPAPCQGANTSRSALHSNERAGSVDLRTSTFSFRAPIWTSYPVHTVPQHNPDPRPVPAGYSSDGGAFTRTTQPPTQASVQTSAAPSRPSAYQPIPLLNKYFTGAQGDQS